MGEKSKWILSDEEIKDNVRKNLMRLRRNGGYTQQEIAKMIGKTPNAVSMWEQGQSVPDIVTVYHLAKFYHVTLDDIYANPSDASQYNEKEEALTIGANPKQADSAIVDMLIEKLVNSEVEKKLAENMLKIEKLKNKKTLGD